MQPSARARTLLMTSLAAVWPGGDAGACERAPAPDSTAEGSDSWRCAVRDEALLHAVAAASARGVDGEDDVLALAADYPRLLLWEPAGPDGLVRAGRGERRSRGAFATPAALASQMAESACMPLLERGVIPQIVDPACGAGALLRAALGVLLRAAVPPADAALALHGVDLDPVAVALARAALTVDLRRAGIGADIDIGRGLAGRIVCGDALLGPGATSGTVPNDGGAEDARFRWHEAFPDVLARDCDPPEPVTGWRGGFDVVVANPPWERWKVHARDWSGTPPHRLRDVRARDAAHVRASGRHPLTGRGEVNAYLPFLETCWRLLAPRGRASVVVPAGVATDRSSSALMVALVGEGSLERLRLLAEGEAAFGDVSARVPIAVLDLQSGAPRGPQSTPVTVPPASVVPPGARGGWPLDVALMRLVAPNVPTVPLCGSAEEAELLARTHRGRPVLLRRESGGRVAGGGDPWHVRLVTPLHMSRDARHFVTAPGPGLVPLWEAKQAGLLDHRGGSVRAPRYWVPEEVMAGRHPSLWARGWLAGFRNVSIADGARTLLPCALPQVAVGNSLPLIDSPHLPLLLAVLASVPVDFLVRAKHAGANLNFFKLEQVALPAPEQFDVEGRGAVTLRRRALDCLADATCWHEDGPDGLARELAAEGVVVPPPGDANRAAGSAGLDAVAAWALGWSRADLETAYGAFARLRAVEEAAHGAFVSRAAGLDAYEAIVDEFGPARG